MRYYSNVKGDLMSAFTYAKFSAVGGGGVGLGFGSTGSNGGGLSEAVDVHIYMHSIKVRASQVAMTLPFRREKELQANRGRHEDVISSR